MHFRVSHQWQVNEAFDGPIPELLINPLILKLHMLARGMSRHFDPEKAQAFKPAIDRLPVLPPHQVEENYQAERGHFVDFRVRSIEQLYNQGFSLVEISVQVFGLCSLLP